MIKLTPSPEEIDRLRATMPDGPVVIVNLLEFQAGQAGKDAYLRYAYAAIPASCPESVMLHAGPAFLDVGGGDHWDYVIIMRYPSFAQFADTVTHPTYQGEAASHRLAALKRTIMLVTRPGDLFHDLTK